MDAIRCEAPDPSGRVDVRQFIAPLHSERQRRNARKGAWVVLVAFMVVPSTIAFVAMEALLERTWLWLALPVVGAAVFFTLRALAGPEGEDL